MAISYSRLTKEVMTTKPQMTEHPRKPQPAKATTFLWVNKTANSSSFSNNKTKGCRSPSSDLEEVDARAINAHAQRARKRQIRQQKVREYLEPTPASRLVDRELVKPAESPSSESDEDVEEELQSSACWALQNSNFKDEDCIDPFNTTCIPVNREVHRLIEYYIKVSISCTYKSEIEAKPSHLQKYAERSKAIIRGSLENKVHLLGLLAFCAGRMVHITGVSPGVVRIDRAQCLMYAAVQTLRAYFKGFDSLPSALIDKQIILTLVHVSSVEWYFGDYDAARVHFRVIKGLLPYLDESNEYDRYLKDVPSRSDVFMAAEMLSPPLLPLRDAPGNLSQWEVGFQSHHGAIIGSALRSLPRSERMKPVIQDLVRCLPIWQEVRTNPCNPTAHLWTGQRMVAILHKLLSLTLDDELSAEDECVRITLIILLDYVSTYAANRMGTLNAARLRRALRSAKSLWTEAAQLDTLLWILITGMFAAGDSENGDWFASRAACAAAVLGLQKYDEFEDLLGRFLWNESSQAPTLRKLTELVAQLSIKDEK